MNLAIKTFLAVAGGAIAMVCCSQVRAQGFAQEERTTCYSWNGGNHSSGSFIECKTIKPVAKPQPVAVAAPVAQPVLMSNPVCPPQVILEPEPRKKRVYKPRPKPVCK